MSIAVYAVQWCAECRGERPHSKKGKCQACSLRRKAPLRRTTLHRSSSLLRPVRSPMEQDRWRQVKRAVFERDDWRCQRCGKSALAATLDAHHRIPRGTGGTSLEVVEYGMANLVSACRADHTWVETNRKAATTEGWLLSRFGAIDPAAERILTIHGWLLLLDDGSRVAA